MGPSPLRPPQPHLTCGALSQVAGLRGLILRSQLIVLLKHKVGDAAWRLLGLCQSPGAPVLLLPQAPWHLPCLGGAGGGSLSSPLAHLRRQWWLLCHAGVTPAPSCTPLGHKLQVNKKQAVLLQMVHLPHAPALFPPCPCVLPWPWCLSVLHDGPQQPLSSQGFCGKGQSEPGAAAAEAEGFPGRLPPLPPHPVHPRLPG